MEAQGTVRFLILDQQCHHYEMMASRIGMDRFGWMETTHTSNLENIHKVSYLKYLSALKFPVSSTNHSVHTIDLITTLIAKKARQSSLYCGI